jgi:hypothetical protein
VHEGRVGRAIREHLVAHPDEAFTTEHLCAVCYPDAPVIERKHRVAVIRAADKVLTGDPDWRSDRSSRRGQTVILYNAASVMSTAMAQVLRHGVYPTRERLHESTRDYLEPDLWALGAQHQEEIAEGVAEHVAIRDAATPEEAGRLRAQYAAELDRKLAFFPGKVTDAPGPTPTVLAAKTRALMTENDPEAVRAGLAEIADALEWLE